MSGPSSVLPQLVTGAVSVTDGTLTASLLNSAPGSDTGQIAVPVRVISSLGSAGGGLTDTQLRASPVPVSGTFWQATQPVSGTVGISGTVPVSGTFWQATQPVSIATMPSTPVTGTFWQTTQPVSLASVPSHAVTNAGVFVVQEEKVGRSSVNMFSEAVAGIIAETAITMSYSKANATVTTGTSFTPTTGKNLRITSLIISWVATTTTANTCRLRARVNASGAATTSSPIQFSARIAWESPTFIANEGEFQQIPIPDGLEVPNGGGIMWTLACAAANGTLDVSALGFEYTP